MREAAAAAAASQIHWLEEAASAAAREALVSKEVGFALAAEQERLRKSMMAEAEAKARMAEAEDVLRTCQLKLQEHQGQLLQGSESSPQRHPPPQVAVPLPEQLLQLEVEVIRLEALLKQRARCVS